MPIRILSFDISSTCCGWAVLDVGKKIKLFKSGVFKPTKDGSIFHRLREFRNQIILLLNQYKPTQVAIENLIQFMPRQSSANTIITLALYNRTCGLAVLDTIGIDPVLYNVMSIRHGLKEGKTLPAKEDMPALVQKKLGVKLQPKLTRTGKIHSSFYDENDAIAVGLHHALTITNKK